MALLVTALAAAGSSWMTIAAAFGSLFCMFEFQTCACGHLASWQALAGTSFSSVLAWYAMMKALQESGQGYMAVCVALLSTCLFARNLEDLFVLGHHPIWPNHPIAHSMLPSIIETLFVISVFASFGAALCMIAFNLYTWTRGMTIRKRPQTVLAKTPIARDSSDV
jgi:hypothetical protein